MAKANPAPAVTVPTRRGSIEVLRILGAFGIVLFHLKAPGASIGYAALPMFIFLSLYFSITSRRMTGLGRFARDRFARLMVPWLFWCAVFFGLKVGDAMASAHPLSSEFHPWMFATGTALHLWFLPFITVMSILFFAAGPHLLQASPIRVAAVAMVLACGCLALSAMRDLSIPWQQWAFGMPAALLALSMASSGFPRNPATLALWIGGATVALVLDPQGGARQLLITIAAIYLAFCIERPVGTALRYFAGLSFGIYLVHPAVSAALARSGLIPHGAALETALIVFLGSAMITAAMQQLPGLKRFV